MDFRRQGLSPCLSLLMSTFSLLITPPDALQPGFTVRTMPPLSLPFFKEWRIEEAAFYITERSATTCIAAHPKLRLVA